MAWLPFELWLDILEQHHFSAGAIPDYLTLRNLSLCCRALEYPAQKALFRHVVLTRRKQALAFARATDPQTERGKSLGRAVQRLTVKVEESQYKDDIMKPDLVVVLLRCPNLLELTLRSIHMCNDHFSDQDRASIAEKAPRTLRCIRSQHSGFGFLIAQLCPWITALSLGGSSLDLLLMDEGPLNLQGIVELQWYGDIGELVAALYIQATDEDGEDLEPSLQILGLRGVEANFDSYCTGIGRMFMDLGPVLRSLHLAQIDENLVDYIRDYLRNLEEFILDNLPSEKLLDSLPPTLQHLQVRTPDPSICANDIHSEPMRQWVSTAPNLKVLTWVVGPCNGHGVYQKLEDACKEAGATLRLYVKYFGAYPGEHDSLAMGPVKSFPRPVAFSPARGDGAVISYSAEQFLSKVGGETPRSIPVPGSQPQPRLTATKRQHPRNPRHKKAALRVPPTVPRKEAAPSSSGSTFVPKTASGGFTFKFGSS